jgi:hypothetical protein
MSGTRSERLSGKFLQVMLCPMPTQNSFVPSEQFLGIYSSISWMGAAIASGRPVAIASLTLLTLLWISWMGVAIAPGRPVVAASLTLFTLLWISCRISRFWTVRDFGNGLSGSILVELNYNFDPVSQSLRTRAEDVALHLGSGYRS